MVCIRGGTTLTLWGDLAPQGLWRPPPQKDFKIIFAPQNIYIFYKFYPQTKTSSSAPSVHYEKPHN